MKRIILEYSSPPLFGSFNGGNGKSIPLFESLSGREWNWQEGTLIPLYSLKTLNFHSSRNWEEWEGMELDLGFVWEFIREWNGMIIREWKGMEKNGMKWN